MVFTPRQGGLRGVVSAGGVLLALALLACASSEARKVEEARAAVRDFFTGLGSRDCAALAPLLATGGSAKSCEDTVRELHEHQLELLDIVDATVDGRDANAVLVRIKVARDGAVKEAPLVLRVEHQGGRWKLRL
jgi:hypothetical protein